MRFSEGTISQRIVKAMGLFGGVQVITILCSLIRTKLIAIWIGPIGVGLFSLYNSAIDTISSATSLSIRNSSVRDLASATTEEKKYMLIAAIRRWSWIVGIFGAVVTLLLAPLLSRWTFNSTEYSWCFVIISIVFVLNAYADGERAILQGCSKLAALAKGSVVGVALGVVVSAPMFYLWRLESIIPAIIVFSVATAIGMWWYSRRIIHSNNVKLTTKQTISLGKDFVKLGTYMMLSGFVGYLFSYLFVLYLNHNANTEEVGYFQAGYTLVNKYAGLLFTAMAMEYYPRLAQASHSKNRLRIFVTQQINLTLFILLPIMVLFMLFREVIVQLLYSSEFMVILPFITFAIIGTIYRAISWSMAYVVLAKGSGKLYLLTETLSAITTFGLNVWFYHIWGLTGIGIAYVVNYLLYTLIIGVCYLFYYKLSVGISILWVTLLVTALSVMELIAVIYGCMIVAILIGVISILIAIFLIYKTLSAKNKG